jgi:hypothetical protein
MPFLPSHMQQEEPKVPQNKKSPFKWIVLLAGSFFGIAHIGILGHLLNKDSQIPIINLPVGDYTSYTVEAGTEGYKIHYQSNDPKVMKKTKDIDKTNGLFGIGGKTVIISEKEYTMSQSESEGGDGLGKLTAKKLECIKAEGGGENTGAIVGASIGASTAPLLSGIPYIGWIAAGWATMFGQKQGSEIGGEIARMANDCEDT